MRPLLAGLITISLIGGVYGYLRFADGVRRPPVEIQIDYATGNYSVLIETTFECVGDPVLELDALNVMFMGESIFSQPQSIPAGEQIEISPLEGVEVGENEIHVAATMSESTPGLGVLKATIQRDGVRVLEKLISSEPGLLEVAGPVVFQVAPAAVIAEQSEPGNGH